MLQETKSFRVLFYSELSTSPRDDKSIKWSEKLHNSCSLVTVWFERQRQVPLLPHAEVMIRWECPIHNLQMGVDFWTADFDFKENGNSSQILVMISFLHVVNKEGFIPLLKQFKRLDLVTYGAKRRVRAWDKEKVWRSLRTYLPFYRQLLQHNGLSGLIYSKQATFSFKLSFSIVNRNLKKVHNLSKNNTLSKVNHNICIWRI